MNKKLRAVFMGSPDFAVSSLQAAHDLTDLQLVVSQPDRPAGRGRKLTPPPVKVAAEEMGIPVFSPEKVRDGVLFQRLEELELDIILVTAYGRILPEEILALPKYGCVNVHASILPRWRGAAPIQRSVLAGDEYTGVSIMQMGLGCDTGAVFNIERTKIGERETSGELFERLAEIGGDALRRFLSDFESRGEPTLQDETKVVHAAKLLKADGKVCWEEPAVQVARRIRAMDPWPAAVATFRGKAVKLYGAAACPAGIESDSIESDSMESGEASPGTVLVINADSIEVQCQEGAVEVMEIQPTGKRRMSAQAFSSGYQLAVGDTFDLV